MGDWIKCSEQVPNGNENLWIAYKLHGVMCVSKGYFCDFSKSYQFYDNNVHRDYDTTIPNALYWMPYKKPEPPKDE